jgi:predicted nucleic acid-binding protein
MCNFVKYCDLPPKNLSKAIDIDNEHKYSFWDSAIIATAIEGEAGGMLPEDLTDNQQIKGYLLLCFFYISSGPDF